MLQKRKQKPLADDREGRRRQIVAPDFARMMTT
jgi:hypothetical protein